MPAPTLDYAKVTGTIAIIVSDKTDVDENPDIVYADAGTVTFTPLVKQIEVPGATPPVVLGVDVITATVDINGRLSRNGLPEVYLPDLASPLIIGAIPRGEGAWLVSFSVTAAGKAIPISSFYCNPAAGVTNDIATMIGTTTSAGQQIVVGPGVAAGGTTGQVLTKNSNADYDTEWTDEASGGLPVGGTTGQALVKNSNTDLDAGWATVAAAGVPTGGTSGQVLAKTSSTNYATAWVAPTAGPPGPSGSVTDFSNYGILGIDSYSGTDDQKLAAAIAQAKADTYPRTLVFSARQWSFANRYTLNWNGVRFSGPLGGMEREFRETNRIICPAGGLFQFPGSSYRDFSIRGLAFQASGSGVFMPAWATDNSAGSWQDVNIEYCGFQGFSSIIEGTVLRCKTDDWYINGATNTQLKLGGSDSRLFMSGMNFASGAIPSNKAWFDIGMSSTDFNMGYVTPQGGYALNVSYTQGGLVIHGGKSDATGRSGSTATQQAGILQNVPAGRTIVYRDVWVFNAGQNGTAKGLIEIHGGDAVLYSPVFPGSMTGTTPAHTTIPGVYAASGCKVRVISPLAENSGYKHLAKQSGATMYCDDASWTIDTVA